MLLPLVGLTMTALAAPAPAQDGAGEPCTLKKRIVRTLTARYLLFLPKGYNDDKARKWPLMLFLHGAGERGNDLEKLKVHGPPKLATAGKELPFILVAPQCPENGWWETETLGALLDEVQTKHRVDLDRVYCTGLSMGGYGTWAMALAYPKRFAAVAPICGGGQARLAGWMMRSPAWVFHGAKDNVVPLAESEAMVAALKSGGIENRFTVYPEAGHDSWTEAYNTPELFDWLLSHKLPLAEPKR
ncbi:MAG: prolyl oligopeptidase family serine peptidase [Armatimonadetes bacterium]|nr:prolyl oligopeptidase family serine peptidase [Armatimonadota bacterium]